MEKQQVTDIEILEKYAIKHFQKINDMSETKKDGKFQVLLDNGTYIILVLLRWNGDTRVKAQYYKNMESFLDDDAPYLSDLGGKIEG